MSVPATPDELRTARLVLRRWRPGDLDPFAALCADPRVMEHFEAPLARVDAADLIEHFEVEFAGDGIGRWAVEHGGELIGFAGLAWQHPPLPFAPAVEIGWRFAAASWGKGLAMEAAAAAIDDGFGRAGLADIVSMTATTNTRSIALMERLGMHRSAADDFDHPAVSRGHRLERHVLYRLRADEWPGAAIVTARAADAARG